MAHAYGWYDGLTAAILAALEQAVKLEVVMGPAIKVACGKAVTAVNQITKWAEAHLAMTVVVITLITLIVFALIMPWLMAYLGFLEEGILEGKFTRCFYSIVS